MDIKTFLEKKQELNDILKKHGRAMLIQFFKEFLESVKDKISAIRWMQFTPYFNDGDPCVFGLRGPSYNLVHEKGEPTSIDIDEDEEDWKYKHYYYLKGELKETASKFEKELYKLEDVLESVFGDHTQVTARLSESGELEFETEEYNHD